MGETSSLVYAGMAWSMAGVLVADLFTPLGFAVWVVYFIPVVLAVWSWRPELPLGVALLSTALMAIGYATDEPGMDRSVVLINRCLGIFTNFVIAIVGFYFIRSKIAVRRQDWLQTGQMGLSEAMGGEKGLEEVGDSVLRYLAEYMHAQAGVFYVREASVLRRVAAYGVPAGDGVPMQVESGDGLLWRAVQDRRAFSLTDVPPGYLRWSAGLAGGEPRHLLIVPVRVDRAVLGVLEFGFLREAGTGAEELLERVSGSIGVAVQSANYRTHLQNLLQETQQQAEELQVQGEELRVANEELEEQSRALQESQLRLENQQAELEQTNTQLEEQSQELETQRDDLSRAHAALELRARELEQASRFKSDFLANMSHELRTPLNSALILARLLADNREGNLSDEQVQYAETILMSGNDLLALINDVLDLSKIEAGRMEMRPEPTPLAQLVDDLSRAFRPQAEAKGLSFRAAVDASCPESIETDRQRLEQVLKNLLANSIKFTERGEVALEIRREAGDRVALAVHDTGIGIPAHQHELIFEAFRQADGNVNRRHGGTGLGLSICRELVRLLGGEMRLQSEPGHGSTFTVVIPGTYDPARVRSRGASATAVAPEQVSLSDRLPAAPRAPAMPVPTAVTPLVRAKGAGVADDRERLAAGGRVLLIIEDDEPFARILYDLGHELGFRCVVATTAEEGLAAATWHPPSAVLLDVGLPDQSGLSVLDRLKHDGRTRHIPVHVISASDHSETARALGAIGHLMKPVERETLIEAIQGFEARLAQHVRRVLIVEDDPVQRDGLGKLLGSRDVETVGVSSAAECLALLRDSTFDCMVLDLSLPDTTGYALLETLSREDAYSFPPVIVYTGRDLSADEEQRLRRYSRSIIIKGAKSPERLLDEVTLFLHQVVADLPPEQQRMIRKSRSRDAALEGRRLLIVEDDVRNVFALTSILEPRGAIIQIARNGREAVELLNRCAEDPDRRVDLVLMDVMMPEMDGLAATREIRKHPAWKKLPILMLTAKAMRDDQEQCLAAGANDYMAKPLDVEKLLSLVRVWMPR